MNRKIKDLPKVERPREKLIQYGPERAEGESASGRKDIKQKVQLSPIPEAILRVYRRIFK